MIYLTQVSTAASRGLPYYADWIITTPLIVLSLGYTIHKELSQEVTIAAVTQILTIFSALVYANNPSGSSLPMIASVFFFTITVYWLYTWLKTGEYALLSWITLLTWFAYPAVYYAHDGLLGEATTALVILPLLSKHVFTSLKEFYY
jgi:bacteriorhodopsin